jgi:hypothetical protein
MTRYQISLAADLARELAARRARYVQTYGERFLDVILVTTDGHATGHDSYALVFGSDKVFGNRSHARGFTLERFAKKAYPQGGSLKLIERTEYGARYAVLAGA